MAQLTSDERRLLTDLSQLTHCNPFEPRRIELERAVLGGNYQPDHTAAWSRTAATGRLERPNVRAITHRASALAEGLRERQATEGPLGGSDVDLYDDLLMYVLYYRHFAEASLASLDPSTDDQRVQRVWTAFERDRQASLAPLHASDRRRLPLSSHVFAVLHQVRRAFHWVFECLIGESIPATRLRAAVWQSIFTHDLRCYRSTLYREMGSFATLVTGPSGAGKELVAQAIGRSQYRPFNERSRGFEGGGESFTALNLSALSPTLIESELFGHRRGAFTGADADRIGWLELCPAHGAVFLDEIGELDAAIQVKLLRVAQSRDYSRLGESVPRRFLGKLLAATNRDLAAEMHAGRFREDLYYRLCSDQVVVPSLREQLADRPEALGGLVRFLAARVLGCGEGPESEAFARDVEDAIARQLPPAYPWPGNIRELEQCVRSVLIRGSYTPVAQTTPPDDRPTWLAEAERGALTADELLSAYCRHVHGRTGGYEQAARVLGVDRRTVKARVDG
jgi:hypothetical protein